MDIISLYDLDFPRWAAANLRSENYKLVDIGCSNGFPNTWRMLGDRLEAIGFDGDAAEIARLTAQEANPLVRYIAGMVQSAQPVRTAYPFTDRNPWERLAVKWWFELKEAREAQPAPPQAESLPAVPDIILSDYLAASELGRIDFLKIDVDGPDFELLQSLETQLGDPGVMAVGLEVNFIGGADPTEHTFANTDRLMRANGFDLFEMSTRRYSSRALPGRAPHPYPAETPFGRILQGDALYARDVCTPDQAAFAAGLSEETLLKLAATFSMFKLPDCAAEILVRFAGRLGAGVDIAHGLDLLARQGQDGSGSVSYRDYMQAFTDGHPYFRIGAGADSLG
jgi:hypothetical protein